MPNPISIIVKSGLGIICFILISTAPAHAYIDPGSGGYLITTLLASIGGFLAVGLAVVIHFFRHTFKNFWLALWRRSPFATLLLISLLLGGITLGCYLFFHKEHSQGGLVQAPHVETSQTSS